MGCIRPVTPGFATTCLALIFLGIPCFSVPYIRSVYFLRTSLTNASGNGTLTFGTLGYCVEIASNTTCIGPSVGYQIGAIDIGGSRLSIPVPSRWLTYPLIIHFFAFGLAILSALFGLLAHRREFSKSRIPTFISLSAAGVTWTAFFLDVIYFSIAGARLRKIPGTSVVKGSAFWLTLVACCLLSISACFYTVGRHCLHRRTKKPATPTATSSSVGLVPPNNGLSPQMPPRKESGLPAFPATQSSEYVLVDGNEAYHPSKFDSRLSSPMDAPQYPGGYVPAQPTRRRTDPSDAGNGNVAHHDGSHNDHPPNYSRFVSQEGSEAGWTADEYNNGAPASDSYFYPVTASHVRVGAHGSTHTSFSRVPSTSDYPPQSPTNVPTQSPFLVPPGPDVSGSGGNPYAYGHNAGRQLSVHQSFHSVSRAPSGGVGGAGDYYPPPSSAHSVHVHPHAHVPQVHVVGASDEQSAYGYGAGYNDNGAQLAAQRSFHSSSSRGASGDYPYPPASPVSHHQRATPPMPVASATGGGAAYGYPNPYESGAGNGYGGAGGYGVAR